jgi:hypothetical protein
LIVTRVGRQIVIEKLLESHFTRFGFRGAARQQLPAAIFGVLRQLFDDLGLAFLSKFNSASRSAIYAPR